jgi:hypothetical protein
LDNRATIFIGLSLVRPEMTTQLDQVKGILLGVAVGDKNHGPIHMALLLAESLHEKRKFEGQDVFDRFVDWYRKRDFGADDTGLIGKLVFQAAILDPNKDYSDIVKEVDLELEGQTAGVNGVHRSVALSMCKFISGEDLESLCHQQVKLTHASQIAQDNCFIMNYILRRLIFGEEIDDIIKSLLKRKWDDRTGRALKSYFQDQDDRTNLLPSGGFSPDTMMTTLSFVRKYTRGVDFKTIEPDKAKKLFTDCLTHSFKFAGTANYCPVLVGPIVGCLVGASNIDPIMYQHCLSTKRVLKVCDDIVEEWK